MTSPVRLSLGRALLALLTTKAMLAVLGFGRTLRVMERHGAVTTPLEPDRASLDVVARTIVTAAVLIPGRAECLEQSLVLWYVLRRQGVAVELRFGVRQYPFGAHAWVAYHGEPVNEDPEALRQYAVFA